MPTNGHRIRESESEPKLRAETQLGWRLRFVRQSKPKRNAVAPWIMCAHHVPVIVDYDGTGLAR